MKATLIAIALILIVGCTVVFTSCEPHYQTMSVIGKVQSITYIDSGIQSDTPWAILIVGNESLYIDAAHYNSQLQKLQLCSSYTIILEKYSDWKSWGIKKFYANKECPAKP